MAAYFKDVTPKTQHSYTVQWPQLVASDVGNAVDMCDYADKTVQVAGVLAAALTIEGSNDGNAWVVLNDYAGSPISFTEAGMKIIKENPRYIRPAVAAGAGTNAQVTITGAK